MTQTPPGHLRLHWDPQQADGEIDYEGLLPPSDLAGVLAAATGWQVRCVVTPGDADESPHPQSVSKWELVPPTPQEHSATLASPAAVQTLAEQLLNYHERLEAAYGALREREAELATAVPLSAVDDEGHHLADRLEWVLEAGATALGCDAAALYLLDDATQSLKLRVSWGIPRNRLVEPPRALRGAVADLEALMGSAVVLEDVRLAPFWRAPEGFPAALCVPVSTAHTPLGTAWFFSKSPRPFTDTDVQVAEVITGRIVADLERETLRHEVRRNRDYARQIRDGLVWQQERLPEQQPPVEDWSFAGYRNPAGWLGGGFYDWIVLPDSRILLVAANVEESGVVAALGSAFVRGATWSHASVARDPGDLLHQIHETLWTASPGGQHVSLFAAMIEPESGKWTYAASGRWWVSIGGRKPETELLDTPLLGDHLDSAWPTRKGPNWKRGHRLIVGSASSLDATVCETISRQLSQTRLKKTTAPTVLRAIQEQWQPSNEPPPFDQLLLVGQRHHH